MLAAARGCAQAGNIAPVSGVGPEIFGDDYLHFYAPLLTEERSDREADRIVALLGLPAGARVLDLPCGHGRLANRLAARGLAVTGVDNDELFLARAREDAGARGVHVDYRSGDMREPPVEPGFDAALNWFSSFGYFEDDAENVRCLRALHDALRPGGLLVMDMHDRDALVGRIAAAGEPVNVVETGDDLLIDRAAFDPVTGRSRTDRLTVRDGRLRRTSFSVRMPTFPELRGWLQSVGFRDVVALDECDAPFASGARRLVVVTTR
jgi:SAM-dependent methyltransferase